MKRILVVGASGAGKSTFARQLGARLNAPVIDLDELHWRPDWVSTPPDEFSRVVERLTRGETWIVAGNYDRTQAEVLVPRADAVVWLDHAFLLVIWRLTKRTLRRAWTGEACCNGNRETWRNVLSRDSMILYLLRTFAKKRRGYERKMRSSQWAHLQVMRLKSPREAETWLKSAGD